MSKIIVVQLNAHCKTEEQAARAVESLSRIMVGLALEDLYTAVGVNTVEVEDEE